MESGQQPRVSICIPAYNQTVYLDILLQSIARQKFTDYEIIISDDSDQENVRNLVDSFSPGKKLKYYRNKPSLGSPANWNAAISKASGEYIKIMHHDDAFTSDTALEEMMSLIEANNYDYVFADSKIENVSDPLQNRVHRIRKFGRLTRKPYLLFFGNSIGGPSSLLIKKERFAGMQYDPAYIWLVDIQYYIRLFRESVNGNVIGRPLILTHDAAEHRLTSTILRDFDLQIKEQAMLYNLLNPTTPALTKFFMQVYLARLFCKAKTGNKSLIRLFDNAPFLLHMYFSAVKFKPLYFAYYLLIRGLDLIRKLLF